MYESLGTAGCRSIATRNHNCDAAFNGAEPGNVARAQVHPQPRNSTQLVRCARPPRAGVPYVINDDQILNVSPW